MNGALAAGDRTWCCLMVRSVAALETRGRTVLGQRERRHAVMPSSWRQLAERSGSRMLNGAGPSRVRPASLSTTVRPTRWKRVTPSTAPAGKSQAPVLSGRAMMTCRRAERIRIMWDRLLSNDAIIAMVGHEAFARGMVYARNGNVEDVRVDPEQLTVSGQIVGSDRKRYLVLVGWPDPGGCHRAPCHLHLPGRAGLQARGRRVVHRPGPAAADARSARPAWEGLVTRLVREVPTVPTEPVPVGLELAVDVGRAYGGFQPPPRLLMRPVRGVDSEIGGCTRGLLVRSRLSVRRASTGRQDLLLQFGPRPVRPLGMRARDRPG